MADNIGYHFGRNPAVHLLSNVRTAKDLHAVPWWKRDACLFCISLQIGGNGVRGGYLGPWRVVPQEDLALSGVTRSGGLYVRGKSMRNLRPQRNLDPNPGLRTYNREGVPIPINVIKAEGKDVRGTPSITCRCDEDGEVSLAQGPCSIDGCKDPFERGLGDSFWRPFYHLA